MPGSPASPFSNNGPNGCPNAMLIAGNWKMNKDVDEARALARSIAEQVTAQGDILAGVGIACCPSFVCLPAVREALEGSPVAWGAQNMHHEDGGAYTGEVSASMLTSLNCTYVILGHSERRQYFGETDQTINQKVKQAHAHDLVPILCVGETLEQRKSERAQAVVREQLDGALSGVEATDALELVIAYEPVWAIGTGETATPEQAQEMHAFIRGILNDKFGDEVGGDVHILYGGSMKPHNAESLLQQPDVDGGLIGGASLEADSFVAIASAGADVQTT